jgi:hypothetical protein
MGGLCKLEIEASLPQPLLAVPAVPDPPPGHGVSSVRSSREQSIHLGYPLRRGWHVGYAAKYIPAPQSRGVEFRYHEI